MTITDSLFLIPARGGSKGLPRKNILPMAGKPLIYYTIDAARGVTTDDNICISSEDDEIIQIVQNYGMKVPFTRPLALSSDTAGSWDVMLHALDYYEKILGRAFSKLILLQPTSPLRNSDHIREAYALWESEIDMVVSVRESKSNPYFNLFEENDNGFLIRSKEGNYQRRQDAPAVWEFNGAIYIISVASLRSSSSFSDFRSIRKYPMKFDESLDIDTKIDWDIAESMINKRV